MCIRDRVKRLKSDYNRNLRTGIILSTKVEKVTYDANNRLVSQADTYRLIKQKLIDDTPKGKYTAIGGSGNFTLPESLGLLTEKQAQDIMKYSSKGSLVEELKSAGFSIPSGCPDSVMLRDVRIEKSLSRTGTSATRYCFAVHYKPDVYKRQFWTWFRSLVMRVMSVLEPMVSISENPRVWICLKSRCRRPVVLAMAALAAKNWAVKLQASPTRAMRMRRPQLRRI